MTSQMDSFIGKSRPIHNIHNIMEGMVIMQVEGKDMSIPFEVGNPGMAKTALWHKACKDRKWGYYTKHLGMIPIEEIGGIPQFYNISDKVVGTHWSKPEIVTDLEILSKQYEIVVCHFDDIHVASQSHFNLMYEMFTEQALRSHKFPKNVGFVMSGNPSQKAGAKPIPSAIINRCAKIPVHLEFDDWKTDFALKDKTKVHSSIVSFLTNEKNRELFHEPEQVSNPWASPRSWTRFSNLLSAMELGLKESLPMSDVLYWGAAHVGETAIGKFASYYKLFREVNAADVFDGKDQIRIPSDLGRCYIYMMAMIDEFFNRLAGENKKENRKEEVLFKHCNIMAKTIMTCGSSMIEMAVPSLKEIVMTSDALDLKNTYTNVKLGMLAINKELGTNICGQVRYMTQ